MKVCPSCKGHKKAEIFAGGTFYLQYCPTCNGTGEVDDELCDKMEEGLRLRTKRIRQGWSLRNYASCVGVSPTALSQMEQGNLDIPEWVWSGLSK